MKGLGKLFEDIHAVAWGGVDFEVIRPKLSPEGLALVEKHCPNPQSILIAAFPYYSGEEAGNLSLYARGRDYHTVVTGLLSAVVDGLREDYPEESFWISADNSPLPELEIAFQAGLGLRGKHGLLIVPPYGSYLFLGTILSSVALPYSLGNPPPDCISCNACITHCPTGVRSEDGFLEGHCLSHITQQKGDLSPGWVNLLQKHPLVWGCDICQKVCPYNRDVPLTPIADFREGLICNLTPEDLEGLSNRTFQEKYGDRAFAWRGPTPLRRNLGCQGGAT